MTSADWDDVRFDYEGSLALARRLWDLADRLDTLGVARNRWGIEALVEWEGRLGDQFADRIDSETSGCARLSADLREAANQWAQAWADALNQQNRRLYARAVHRIRDDRGIVDSIIGGLFGHDDLPPEPSLRSTPIAPAFLPTGGFATSRANQ